ncbi:hypothetical protein AVEN_138644-1 [Araneus ventricosus]|uniref:Uncharacterized protein n=1 Tax=Araneus ventricosus TaxID=182803 RepID=A0A4Y2E2R7_ARAVE|nr:hypothetical protein AVEN_138644-1 [Araneus ventricosus]
MFTNWRERTYPCDKNLGCNFEEEQKCNAPAGGGTSKDTAAGIADRNKGEDPKNLGYRFGGAAAGAAAAGGGGAAGAAAAGAAGGGGFGPGWGGWGLYFFEELTLTVPVTSLITRQRNVSLIENETTLHSQSLCTMGLLLVLPVVLRIF